MPFTRPLINIEEAIKLNLIREEVIVQSGKTEYKTTKMQLIPFMDRLEMEKYYDEASLVICQAGVGSIMMGLKKNKKILSMARLKEFDEHIDDHQLEILHVFSIENYIMPWGIDNGLEELLIKMKTFEPKKYPFQEEKISDTIINYLNNNIRK